MGLTPLQQFFSYITAVRFPNHFPGFPTSTSSVLCKVLTLFPLESEVEGICHKEPPPPGFEPGTSRSTSQLSTNWANRSFTSPQYFLFTGQRHVRSAWQRTFKVFTFVERTSQTVRCVLSERFTVCAPRSLYKGRAHKVLGLWLFLSWCEAAFLLT